MKKRVLLMAFMLLGLTMSAQALQIKYNGGEVFNDDLEGYSGFRPNPNQPPWVIVHDDDWTQPPEGTVWVETADHPPDPAAHQGEGYLTVKRVDTGHGWDVAGQINADCGGNQTTGVFRAEFALNARSYGGGNNAVIQWLSSPFSRDQPGRHSALFIKTAGVYYLAPGGWTPTGLPALNPGWNEIVYELNLDTDLSSVTINGTTVSGLAAGNPSIEVGGLKFYGGGNGAEFGVDAIPEPVTLCLLSLGGVLVARRRK